MQLIRRATALAGLLLVTIAFGTDALWGGAVAQTVPPQGAAEAVQEARGLAQQGNHADALRTLESFLARSGGTAGEPDLAIVRLEAARAAAASRQPERTRAHLAVAERIVARPVFNAEPVLRARLQSELARVRERIGDTRAVERLLSAALPVLERADPAAAADAFNARGTARLELLRLPEATADFLSSVALLERAGGQAGTAAEPLVAALTNLATARAETGDAAGAGMAARQARTAARGDARLLRAADFAEAQARLHALDLATADTLLEGVAAQSAGDDPLRGHALLALATARFDRGQSAEAVEIAAASVEAYRATLGEWHPAYGRALHTLGTAQSELGSTTSARATLQRAAEVLRGALGASATQVQETEIERGWLDLRADGLAAAEERARGALAAYAEMPPPDQRPEGLATILLGLVRERQGRVAEAAALFRRGQSLIEAARGRYSPDLGFSLVRLGRLLTRSGQFGQAEAPLNRAIEIYQRIGGAGTVRLAEALAARAELRARAGRRRAAIDDTRQSAALLRDRVLAAGAAHGIVAEAQRRGVREQFASLALLMLELMPGDPAGIDDAFAASQESLTSRAGEALRQSAARFSASDSALAGLLRVREAASDALRQADAFVFAAATRPGETAAQDAVRFRAARDAAADKLRAVEGDLAARYVGYAQFLAPKPVALAAVQSMLADDEALLAPLAADAGLLVWVVRRGDLRALPVDGSRAELAELVARVRAGVDLRAIGQGSALPMFDIAAARLLHTKLIGATAATGLLEGVRHLIFVPDGPLQSLPLHLLLDERMQWLVRSYAVTVAPSVTSAVAARWAVLRPSAAPHAFLGVGDPVFSGFDGQRRPGQRGLPDVLRRELARLPRLAETAEELRRIAVLYDSADSRLLLGGAATAHGVLAAQPVLYRVISFATHALMSGDLPGLTEPAIVLTPGEQDAASDGLLTASDVAALELDADLVLLSACNTAASDGGPFPDGLSGLARAFLVAGARTLLVSHWDVASAATVELTTNFVAALRADTRLRRAEALQAAMLTMIDSRDPGLRHPAFWAAFVVVGG